MPRWRNPIQPTRLDNLGTTTLTQKGRRVKRVVCWMAGHHTWGAWRAGASGWPMRSCKTCGTRQVRLDASW